MPEGTKPASGAQQPRPLRRTLLIAGLSCLSATVIAAGFFWLRPARRTSLETNAVGCCRAYCEAQTMYHRNDWDNDGRLSYAHPFPKLDETNRDGCGLQLTDGAFAAATSPNTPKHGYWFRDMETIAGRSIDWTKDFALCAMPAVYGRTGYRVFIVKTDGTTWAKDLGRSDFVADFPADPAAAGWQIAE
jgi:hypothetical protein